MKSLLARAVASGTILEQWGAGRPDENRNSLICSSTLPYPNLTSRFWWCYGKPQPLPGAHRLILVCSLAIYHRGDGPGQNLDIEPQGPMVDVVHIHLHPFLKGQG